jgi:hypothetical protein
MQKNAAQHMTRGETQAPQAPNDLVNVTVNVMVPEQSSSAATRNMLCPHLIISTTHGQQARQRSGLQRHCAWTHGTR